MRSSSFGNWLHRFSVLLIFSGSNFIHTNSLAQNLHESSVTINSPLDTRFNAYLEKKLFSLLNSVTEYSEKGINTFNSDRGIELLIREISEQKFVPILDSIETVIIKNPDNSYSVPHLFFRPIENENGDWDEFEFTFSGYAELIDVKKTNKKRSPERILINKTEASEADKINIMNLLNRYEQAFSVMDLNMLSDLFEDDAVIIAGLANESDKKTEYKRYPVDFYLKKLKLLKKTIFKTVAISFSEEKVLLNPDSDKHFGFFAKQKFKSETYSDDGYVFFVVSFENDEQGKIVSRNWLEEPIKLEKVIEKIEEFKPAPVVVEPQRMLEAELKDVRIQLDEASEKLTQLLPREEGFIQIELETNNKDLINSSVIKEWLKEGFMRFDNLKGKFDSIELVSDTTVRFPFVIDFEEGMQKVQSEISITNIPRVLNFKSVQSIYLQRLNVIEIKLLSQEETKEIIEMMQEFGVMEVEVDAEKTESTEEIIVQPKRVIQAQATEVRKRVDNSNLNLTKSIPSNQGLLQIELLTNIPDQINAQLVRDWILNKTMYIDGITLMTDFMEIVDKSNVRIPFKTISKPILGQTDIEIAVLETPVIQYFSTRQKLSLQQLNIVTVKFWTREIQTIYREKKEAMQARQIRNDRPSRPLEPTGKIDSGSLNVRSRIDNSNLSLTKAMPSGQGLLVFEIETNNPIQVNAALINEWIANKTLKFDNIELLPDFSDIVDRLTIRIPFRSATAGKESSVNTTMFIDETPLIDSFSTNQELYFQQTNVITIKAIVKNTSAKEEEKKLVEESVAEEMKFEGKVRFTINQDNVRFQFIADNKFVLHDSIQSNTDIELQVLRGPYKVVMSKKNFQDRIINIQILENDITKHTIILLAD